MPKLKKGDWLPKEVKRLLKIQRSPTAPDQLRELAKEWGRDYYNLYNKWMYEISKIEKDEDVIENAMEFTIDTKIKTPKRSNSTENKRMRAGLGATFRKLEVDGGNIPIASRFYYPAKKFLTEQFPNNHFTITKEKRKGKHTGTVRIFKRK